MDTHVVFMIAFQAVSVYRIITHAVAACIGQNGGLFASAQDGHACARQAYVHSDDIRHGEEGGESSSELCGELGVPDLFLLRILSVPWWCSLHAVATDMVGSLETEDAAERGLCDADIE